MYWVRRNVAPNRAKNVIVIPVLAALNLGFLKKRTSSIGWSVVRCHHRNVPSRTAANANDPMVVASVQPFDGASMIA